MKEPKRAKTASTEPRNIVQRVVDNIGLDKKALAGVIGVQRKTLDGWIKNGVVHWYRAARFLGELTGNNADFLADYDDYKREAEARFLAAKQKQEQRRVARRGGSGGGSSRKSGVKRRKLDNGA